MEVWNEALTNVFRARLNVKRSGGGCEQHRRNFRNWCTSRSREHACDVIDTNRQMEMNEPLTSHRKKNEEGLHHLDEEEGVIAREYFKCGRKKPECGGTKV